jgi:ParB-like chromosome segregation protein Spo0J
VTEKIHGIRTELVRLATPIAGLEPYPGNARKGNVDAIVESLEAHGQYRPIVVRRTEDGGQVLAGNHTLAAAGRMGWTHIAATWVDVDDDQARRIVLVDNRTNDVATYDDELLAELLQEVAGSDRGFDGTGFEEEDLAKLLDSLEPDGPPPDDDPPAEPEVFGVAVACGTEEQRDGLMERLRELGYEPTILNGRWGDLKG